MALVFSAERNYIEFLYKFEDGSSEKMRYYEMNPNEFSEFVKKTGVEEVVNSSKKLLDKNVEGNRKDEMIIELLEKGSANNLFKMVEALNSEVEKVREKK